MCVCVCRYVLHLLSYHIDFPTSPDCSSESDGNRLKVVVRSIRMVLLALQSSLRNEASNIPYLLKQIHLISQVYCDRIDPENIGLQFMAGITRNIIQENVKTAENVQVYPGNISLPAELFQLKKVDPDESAGTAAQTMIDRAIAAAAANKPGKQTRGGKPNLGKILSPVRRAHVAASGATRGVSPASVSSSGADSKQSNKSAKAKPKPKAKPKAAKPRATAKSKKAMKSDAKPAEDEQRGSLDVEEDDDDEDVEEDREQEQEQEQGQGEQDTRSKPPQPPRRKRSSKAATATAAGSHPSPVPEEKTRSLPARRAKAAVSTYKEADVSEKEINSWDESAGEVKRSARKRSLDSRASTGRGGGGGGGEQEEEEDDDQEEETLLMTKRRAMDESFNSTKRVSSYSIKDILVLEPEVEDEVPSPKATAVHITAQKSKSKDKDTRTHTHTHTPNKRRDSELDLAAEELDEFVAVSSRLPRESAEWDSMLEVRGSGEGGGKKASNKPNPRRPGPIPPSSSKNIVVIDHVRMQYFNSICFLKKMSCVCMCACTRRRTSRRFHSASGESSACKLQETTMPPICRNLLPMTRIPW